MKKKNTIWIYPLIIMGFLLFIANACKDLDKKAPVLTTTPVTEITSTTAGSGGDITGGCSMVYARGVCWSTNPTPTIADNKTTDGSSMGNFSSLIAGLTPNTTYYLRAYANNDEGIGYGNTVSFTTLTANTITDVDFNIYYTIAIGTQTWMVENLKTSRYNNGDGIFNVTDSATWTIDTIGSFCNFNNNANYVATYGRLYNWYAVNDSRSLAPTGWHVANEADWATLITYLGGQTVAGAHLKEAGLTHWASPNTGADNSSGFTALPAGYRSNDGTFDFKGEKEIWWSTTQSTKSKAWVVRIGTDSQDADLDTLSKYSGLSVRCVKN